MKSKQLILVALALTALATNVINTMQQQRCYGPSCQLAQQRQQARPVQQANRSRNTRQDYERPTCQKCTNRRKNCRVSESHKANIKYKIDNNGERVEGVILVQEGNNWIEYSRVQ